MDEEWLVRADQVTMQEVGELRAELAACRSGSCGAAAGHSGSTWDAATSTGKDGMSRIEESTAPPANAVHGRALFITMCAGTHYFQVYCGPLFASFERAYRMEQSHAGANHRLVAFTSQVDRRILEVASRRFAPWGHFEEAEAGGGRTEEEVMKDVFTADTELGHALYCEQDREDDKKVCRLSDDSEVSREKKTMLDSMWFPRTAVRYLEEHLNESFCYAAIVDSDMLFSQGLAGYLRDWGCGGGEPEPGSGEWDVAFTVYDPDFRVPWSKDAADVGRTRSGYRRINGGVLLLSLQNWTASRIFIKKSAMMATALMVLHEKEMDEDVSQDEEQFIFMKWQKQLVREFRGNDQASVALLACSFEPRYLEVLLGWETCILCERALPMPVDLFKSDHFVRLRALPARILNHPEAMVDGMFPDDLRIVHLKGLWWRVALPWGAFTRTATRAPHWNREAYRLWHFSFRVWQASLPRHLVLLRSSEASGANQPPTPVRPS